MDVQSDVMTYTESTDVDGMLADQHSEQILVQMTNGDLCPVVATTENDVGVKLPADTMEQLRQGKAVLYRVGERNEMWFIQPDALQGQVEHFDDIGVQGIEMTATMNMEMTGELVDDTDQEKNGTLCSANANEEVYSEQLIGETPKSDTNDTQPVPGPIVISVQQKKLTQARYTPLSGSKPLERSGPVHQCNYCGASFGALFQLKRHTYTHTGDRPYDCPSCNLSFRHKTSLKVHLRKHTGEMPYSCDVCSKQFRDPANYKVHVKSHSEEKNYECSVCQKRFNAASTLHAHRKTHELEKPFVCSFCGKTFRFNTTLIRHIRTHTGEKPYSCGSCDISFSTASNLAAHRKRHDNPDDRKNVKSIMYCCDQCDYQFHTKGGLRTHSKQHQTKSAVAQPRTLKPSSTETHAPLTKKPRAPKAVPEVRWITKGDTTERIQATTLSSEPEKIVASAVDNQPPGTEPTLPEKLSECKTCGKRFESDEIYIAHLRTHNLSKGISFVYTQSVP